jgi:hypothetical protein
MVVDFVVGKAAGFRGVTVAWKGPWNESRIRKEFGRLSSWAKKGGIRTGNWYFFEPSQNRWRVAIEVKGKARGSHGLSVRPFPPSKVVRVRFDPDAVSPRVIYHGLTDFLRYRRKDGTVKSVGAYREVYQGDPWTDKKAWANLTVEALVR